MIIKFKKESIKLKVKFYEYVVKHFYKIVIMFLRCGFRIITLVYMLKYKLSNYFWSAAIVYPCQGSKP